MSTQKRKADASDHDSDIKLLFGPESSTTVATDMTSHKNRRRFNFEPIFKPSEQPKISRRMHKKPSSARETAAVDPSTAAPEMIDSDSTRGTNNGSCALARPKIDIGAEVKEIRAELKEIRFALANAQRTLDRLLAQAVRVEASQPTKEKPVPPKTYGREGTVSDFHQN